MAQPEFIAKQIDEKYLTIQKYIQQNDYEKINKTKQEMLVLMNIYNLCTYSEDKDVFTKRISDINTRITELNKQISPALSTISAENSGYFVSFTDGFEDKLNFDSISTITPEEISNIISTNYTKKTDCVGKIIDDYKWKIVGVVKAENNNIERKNVSIKINGITHTLPAYVESMTSCSEGTYKVVLSCNVLNYDLVQERVKEVEIIFNEFSGIKISRKAIRFRDGIRGVYVSYGQKVVFKKVDVVFEGDDFVISKNTQDSNYVMVHDKIVFEEGEYFDENST